MFVDQSAEQGKQVLYFDLQEQAKSSLLGGHYQMRASAELVVLRTVVVADYKTMVRMYMKKKKEVQMYRSLQLEVRLAVMMQYVQADLVSLEKAAEETAEADFEHLVVHVHRGDETAVVKLQEQNADPVAQPPSAEIAGHQRTEEDCSTCSYKLALSLSDLKRNPNINESKFQKR